MSIESHIKDHRRLGAVSILLGNAGLFANGLIAYLHGDNKDLRNAGAGRMVSSLLTSGAGVIIGRYGSSPVSAQLERLENKLAAFMQQHSVPLEVGLIKKANKETQKNWFSKLEDYAYDHPMECANIYNSVAALGMLGSGILRIRKGEAKSGSANIINYLAILAGTLTCVLVPERTPEQIARRGDKGTLWGKMQERPLNFAVWPFLGADLSFGLQSYGEYQTAKQIPDDNPLRRWTLAMSGISAFTMASAVAGDMLTGFSSKKTGGEPKERESAQNELIDLAARILANQPEATQKLLAKQASEYLAKQQGLRMTDFDADKLEGRILEAVGQHRGMAERSGVER